MANMRQEQARFGLIALIIVEADVRTGLSCSERKFRNMRAVA
jgi:hypothetical protein